MKFYAVIFLLILIACGDNQENNDASTETVHANAETNDFSSIGLVDGCYQMINRGDTTVMQLRIRDSTVTGTMITKNGKENLTDTLNLYSVIRDSLLQGVLSRGIGAYGTSSVFLVRNDSLIPRTVHNAGSSENGLEEFKKDAAYVRVNCKE